MSSSASTPQHEEQGVGRLGALVSRLDDELIEWPEGRNSKFLPIDVIQTIKDRELLHSVLKELFPHMAGPKLASYVDSIYRDATKTFGFLLCRTSWKDCGEVIVSLIDEGISDKDLPFSRVDAHRRKIVNTGSSNSQSVASSAYTLGRSSCPCDEHKKCGIKVFSRWKRREMDDLCRAQWITLAPVFENLAHYNFDDNIILPFINDRERFQEEMKRGGYSEVWATRIHPAHQKMLQSTHPLGPLVAIKRLYSGEEKDFKQERDMLVSLTRKRHPHLVKLFITYKFHGRYHLLCAMAKANLRDYWERTPLQEKNKTYLWTLTNLAGIASGLNLIHNFRTLHRAEPDKTNSQSRPSWNFRMKLAPNEELFGRHGDLKPENILWVTDGEGINDAGVLQISDFGLGRFHRFESKSKADPKNVNGSPTYVPPELLLERLISREYDIWSLGCIFLEFITWLLEGQDGLDDFVDARREVAQDGIVDDTYCTLYKSDSGLEGKVREGVTKWIERLRQDHCCSEMILDLLYVVQNQMLIAEPGERVKAQELEILVQKMLIKAKESTSGAFYLLGY